MSNNCVHVEGILQNLVSRAELFRRACHIEANLTTDRPAARCQSRCVGLRIWGSNVRAAIASSNGVAFAVREIVIGEPGAGGGVWAWCFETKVHACLDSDFTAERKHMHTHTLVNKRRPDGSALYKGSEHAHHVC